MHRLNCSILDIGTVWRNWRYFFSTTFITKQIAKIRNKKLSLKINVKNIKKSSLSTTTSLRGPV